MMLSETKATAGNTSHWLQKCMVALTSSLTLVACGGGGGSGNAVTAAPPPGSTATIQAAMVDSLGRQVAESDFGGGDSGAAGADGSAGDGAPIPNAPVVLIDNAGHTATATTDALGYYRLNIKGFTPPFVVKVTRPDGTVWYSHSTAAVKTRGFVTMNLTGLTDKVGGYVASDLGIVGGASSVTPAQLARNAGLLDASKTKLRNALTTNISNVGLDAAVFDPVSTSYKAVKDDKYDRLLENLAMTKSGPSGNTVIVGTFLGGGLSLSNLGFPSNLPSGLVFDSNGNLYIADKGNHIIRKVLPNGQQSVFAGSGVAGYGNGVGASAQFSYPSALAVDKSGNVFVADTGSSTIRKITPTGEVTLFAGSPISCFSLRDGFRGFACFRMPSGLTLDRDGNLYVLDDPASGGNIRKITPEGQVSTITGISTGLQSLSDLVADFDGNLYVGGRWGSGLDGGVVRISGINSVAPIATTLVGRETVLKPSGLAVDRSGNVYFTADYASAIYRVSPGGPLTIIAGIEYKSGYVDGAGSDARFTYPNGLALDQQGNIFVADAGNQAIRFVLP
jgi:sugar lactone lactonase YvrE